MTQFTLRDLDACVSLGNEKGALLIYTNLKLSLWQSVQLAMGINIYKDIHIKAIQHSLYGLSIRMLNDYPYLQWSKN
jgi:hypothetical protein